jgi:hypothetical protein
VILESRLETGLETRLETTILGFEWPSTSLLKSLSEPLILCPSRLWSPLGKILGTYGCGEGGLVTSWLQLWFVGLKPEENI